MLPSQSVAFRRSSLLAAIFSAGFLWGSCQTCGAQTAPAATPQPTPGGAAGAVRAIPDGVPKSVAPAAPPAPTLPASTQAGLTQAAIPDLLKPVTPAQTSNEAQEEKPKDDASHQGIRVHGHWTIDIRNPDGTLARHLDFENSLVGTNDMLGFLYGSEVVSDFAIYLTGTTPPCNVTSGYYCDLVHNLSVLPASARCGGSYDYCVTGLTVTPTFGNNPSLVLAGNMTATQAGSISTVGTFIGICGSPSSTLTTTSASSCAAGNNAYGYGALTQTSISTVSIISGQIIQVSVTITFS